MIQIVKSGEAPQILTGDRAAEAKAAIEAKVQSGQGIRSADFDSSVYGEASVKEQLKKDQKEKCAYCETALCGDYGAVEHYRPKTQWKELDGTTGLGYYWLAYEWDNLLCSCDRCNGQAAKGNLFPLADPATRDTAHRDTSREVPLLINPAKEDPGQHISFHRHIAASVMRDGAPSQKGETTIAVFDLNGKKKRKDLVEHRRREWEKAEMLYRSLIQQRYTPEQAKAMVVATHGSDKDIFAGMIRHQTMWPTDNDTAQREREL